MKLFAHEVNPCEMIGRKCRIFCLCSVSAPWITMLPPKLQLLLYEMSTLVAKTSEKWIQEFSFPQAGHSFFLRVLNSAGASCLLWVWSHVFPALMENSVGPSSASASKPEWMSGIKPTKIQSSALNPVWKGEITLIAALNLLGFFWREVIYLGFKNHWNCCFSAAEEC